MTDCSAPYTYDSTLLENRPAKGQPPTTPNYTSDQNGHPTLDNPSRRTGGTFITFLHGSQPTVKNTQRQKKPFTTPTTSITNASTTTDIPDRPM